MSYKKGHFAPVFEKWGAFALCAPSFCVHVENSNLLLKFHLQSYQIKVQKT